MIRKVQWVYDSKLNAKKRIQTNRREKQTELMKSSKEVQCVKPQIQDHSNKVLVSKDFNRSTVLSVSSNVVSKDFNRSTVLSVSSNVQALRSFQVNHIRHASTIFQTLEEWMPNQFHHVESRETTVLSITH